MQEKNQHLHIPSNYTTPELILLHLGKHDIVTTSPIYLPMQPLGNDPFEDDYNTPGIAIE